MTRFLMDFDKQMDNKSKMNILENKILERDAQNFPALMYMKVKMPGMSVRDEMLRMSYIGYPDGRRLMIIKSVEHPDYPVQKDIIRMYIYKASMMTETP